MNSKAFQRGEKIGKILMSIILAPIIIPMSVYFRLKKEDEYPWWTFYIKEE